METSPTDPKPKSSGRQVSFDNVEVLEFSIVAGADHPSRLAHSADNTSSNGSLDEKVLDSASIALSWKPETRTCMDLDKFEEEQKIKRKGNRLKRMSRAVRKRLLWNAGIETSDIESEDERKAGGKKKKKKKSRKKKEAQKQRKQRNFKMNPFASSNTSRDSMSSALSRDRFASGGNNDIQTKHSDHAPRLPNRRTMPQSPNVSDREERMVDMPEGTMPHLPISPGSSRESLSKRLNRSTMKGVDNLASAFVTLAKQPVKLAKQPARLAVYTTQRVRRRIRRGSQDRDRPVFSEEDISISDSEEFVPRRFAPQKSPSMIVNLEDDNFSDCAPPTLPARRKTSRSVSDASERSSLFDSARIDPDYGDSINTRPTRDAPDRPRRQSSLTATLGILAQQPVKLAKQPMRLARYTTQQVRRRVSGDKKQSFRNEKPPQPAIRRKSHDVDSDDEECGSSDLEEHLGREGLQKSPSLTMGSEDSFSDCAPPLLPAGRQGSFGSVMSDHSENTPPPDSTGFPETQSERRQRQRRRNLTQTRASNGHSFDQAVGAVPSISSDQHRRGNSLYSHATVVPKLRPVSLPSPIKNDSSSKSSRGFSPRNDGLDLESLEKISNNLSDEMITSSQTTCPRQPEEIPDKSKHDADSDLLNDVDPACGGSFHDMIVAESLSSDLWFGYFRGEQLKPPLVSRAPASSKVSAGQQRLLVPIRSRHSINLVKGLRAKNDIGSGDETGSSTVSADDLRGANAGSSMTCNFVEAAESLIGSLVVCGSPYTCV